MKRRYQLIIIGICFIGGLFHPENALFVFTFIMSFPLVFLAVYGLRNYDKKVEPGQISDSFVLATLLSAIFAIAFVAITTEPDPRIPQSLFLG